MTEGLRVVDRPESGRYELLDGDDVAGYADYHDDGSGRLVFPHTVIDPARRGHGLGAVLVRAALDDVRRKGATVVPTCWYVAEFIDANPEYADLLG